MFKPLLDRIDRFIWQETDTLPRQQQWLLRWLRILQATVNDLARGLISLRAMGLVYTTLLSLVPLLAVSFSVLKGFGAHNQLEPALVNLLEPLGEQRYRIIEQVIGFVDNIKVGALGALGLLVLIFTVLSLVKKIESAFNYSWKIHRTRNLLQRASNYLSVILVGPVLIFTAIGITASIHSAAIVNDLLQIEPFGSLLVLLGKALPVVLTVAVFTFIYLLVPNTRVRPRSALAGGIAATLMWKLSSRIFTAFIVNSTNYTAIYSSFAILIIFMLWIYIAWLIVLTGATIAFYHQHPEQTRNRDSLLRLSCRLREKLAFTLLEIIARRFLQQRPAPGAAELATATGMPLTAVERVLNALEQGGLIARLARPKGALAPAHAPESIRLERVYEVIGHAEETHHLRAARVKAPSAVENLLDELDEQTREQLRRYSLKDLIKP